MHLVEKGRVIKLLQSASPLRFLDVRGVSLKESMGIVVPAYLEDIKLEKLSVFKIFAHLNPSR